MKRNRIKRICGKCGKDFFAIPSQVSRGGGKFCSKDCVLSWRSVNDKGPNNPAWKGGKAKRVCETCGKAFFATPATARKGQARFCGQRCYGLWRSNNNNGEDSSSWKGGLKSRKCLMCEKIFEIYPNGARKFCSRKCFGKWMEENKSGKNSEQWIDGRTPIINAIRTSPAYMLWRRGVFIRDNFTCVSCGQHGGDLHAHHIRSFSKLIAEIKRNLPGMDLYSASQVYSPLLDVDNGITLCEPCHKAEHKKAVV